MWRGTWRAECSNPKAPAGPARRDDRNTFHIRHPVRIAQKIEGLSKQPLASK
jgi:hypothetical protein